MNNIYYFAYGSNMLRARLYQRVGYAPHCGVIRLPGYKLVFNGGTAGVYANIMPSPQDHVDGVLYQLTETQIATLDGYEGYPIAYEKRYHIDSQGRIIFFYITPDPLPTRPWHKPHLYYLNLIIEGCLENRMVNTYVQMLTYKNNNYKLKKPAKNKLKKFKK